jgi:RNA polymerase-binding transcription factor DksA
MRTTLSSKHLRTVKSELERAGERFSGQDARQQPFAQALERLDAGSYGTCVICGDAIAIDRLLVIPETPYCISCGSRS